MKRVIIKNGFAPRSHEYTMRLQDGLIDVLKGITSGFGDTFILSGCTFAVTGLNSMLVTDGWMVLQGEVVRVPAQSWPTPTGIGRFKVFKSVGSTVANPKRYRDGTLNNLVEETVATFRGEGQSGIPVDAINGSTLKRLDQIIKEKYDALTPAPTSTWTQINVLAGWTVINSPFPNPAYTKFNGRVYLRGGIKPADAVAPGSNQPFFILPAGFRPLADKTLSVFAETTFNGNNYLTGFAPTWVRIDAETGECYADRGINKEIVLDNISFEVV